MSITNAIDRAYRTMAKRNWDTIYWAIDLHGTTLKANYKTGGYEWINGEAFCALNLISQRRESKIILWSSVHKEEKSDIIGFFHRHGIPIWDFNGNEYEKSNRVSCFDEKFYFSILLDDKAGFDPDTDWQHIINYLRTHK